MYVCVIDGCVCVVFFTDVWTWTAAMDVWTPQGERGNFEHFICQVWVV